MPSGTCSRRSGFADTITSELVASLTPSFSDWWTAGGAFANGDTSLANVVPRLQRHRTDRMKFAARSAFTLRLRVPAGRPVRLESASMLLWHGAGPTGMPAWHARPTNLAVASAAQHVLTRRRMLNSGPIAGRMRERAGERSA